MENCITFQAWVYIGAHTCIHTAQIFFPEQDLTLLTKPHQIFKRDGVKRQNNYLMIKLHNCIFCDNVCIFKSEVINDKVMNKIVLSTWTSVLRDLRELQYSHVRARLGCVLLPLSLPFPILYASFFCRR